MGEIFAIAEFLRVKTLVMIISRKKPAWPVFVVKLPLDCSVKLPFVLGSTRKMPRSRAVFTALSWRARPFAKLMNLVFLLLSYPQDAIFSYRCPPGYTFLMTASRGLRDGYYFY